MWQNGCISHTWVERLCDKAASAWGFVDIILFSTGSPNSLHPLHLCPHTQGLINGLHLASGIWSSAGQYWVACVRPPRRSREGSTLGPWKVGPGPWWKVCFIVLAGRGLFMSLVPVRYPGGFVWMVGRVFVYFCCCTFVPQGENSSLWPPLGGQNEGSATQCSLRGLKGFSISLSTKPSWCLCQVHRRWGG